MTLTNEHLKKIYPNSTEGNRLKYLNYIIYYATIYDINTVERMSAFLAQIGHESGQLSVVEENLNYSAERLFAVFPKYFKTMDIAKEYARKPQKIANKVYADRGGNGKESSGDGWKYRGRGLLQVTLKDNYKLFDEWVTDVPMGCDFVDSPELLTEPQYAVLSAFWYWDVNKLNRYCTLMEEDFRKLTKAINGGYNGYADRVNIWKRALNVLTQ